MSEQLVKNSRTTKTRQTEMPPPSDPSFSASYDRTTKIISTVIAALLLLPTIATQSILVACVAALVYSISYAYSPRRYTISGRSIIVHRLIGNIRIPLDTLREARPATSADVSGAIRLWGNGGVFGYYGSSTRQGSEDVAGTLQTARSLWL